MPAILNFHFEKERVLVTLEGDAGTISLDRNEGILHFQTVLRRLKIRLVRGSRFFMSKAAGYKGHVYIRLELPPGYGPVRSLGMTPEDDLNARLFIEIANSCVAS